MSIHLINFLVPLLMMPVSVAGAVALWRASRIFGDRPWSWWIEVALDTTVICCAIGLALSGIFGHWDSGAAFGLWLAVALFARWRRFLRRRVEALIGAKSRALRDALTARMPTPRTVPGGAS